MSAIAQFKKRLFKPVDAIATEWFSRIFGLIIILQAYGYVKFHFIEQGILAPKFLFTYDLLGFIKPLPEPFLNGLLFSMFVSGIMVMFNLKRRIGFGIFVVTLFYFTFLEKSYYNNHFYLFILIGIVYIFYKPVNEPGTNRKLISYWFVLVLQVLIVIVYFYGGLAKLNYDWVVAKQPLHILLEGTKQNTAMTDLSNNTLALYLLTYGGLFYDLFAGFMLWFRKTRLIAIILSLFFHLSNNFIFNYGESGEIGAFPTMMIGALILFMDPLLIRKRVGRYIPSFNISAVKKTKQTKAVTVKQEEFIGSRHPKRVLWILSVFVAFQLLFPLRHFLYTGNTSWNYKGARFSWRMKIASKTPNIHFYYKKSADDQMNLLYEGKLINTMQRYNLGEDPVMIWQFAQYVGAELKKEGYQNPEVYSSALISLNGRPYQPVVDSTIDLLKVEHHIFTLDSWILPLKD